MASKRKSGSGQTHNVRAAVADDDEHPEAPTYRLIETKPDKERKTWMGASPLAVLTLVLTLAFNVAQMGFTYAHVLGEIAANKLATSIADKQAQDRDAAQVRLIEERHAQITQKLEERHALAMKTIDDRISIMVKGIDRLESSLSTMARLTTDVEVVKNKLTTIDETLRRVERSWSVEQRQQGGALGIGPPAARR